MSATHQFGLFESAAGACRPHQKLPQLCIKQSKGIRMNSVIKIKSRVPVISIAIAMYVFAVSAHAIDDAGGDASTGNGHPVAEVKHAAKEIGHGVKKSTKVI